VPLFVQHFAVPICNSGIEDVILRLPGFAWVHAQTGWRLAAQLWCASAILMLSYVGAVVMFEGPLRRRLDPGDDAWTSLLWALASWRGWVRWLPLLAAAAALGLGAFHSLPSAWEFVSFLTVVFAGSAVWLVLLLMTWNVENLRPVRPPARWPTRWPGMQPLAALIALMIGHGLYKQLTHMTGGNVSAGSFVLWLAIEAALWIPLLVLDTVVLLAWLERAGLREGDALLRMVLRRQVLGPVVAFDVRILLLTSTFVAPILLISLTQIFVVPQLEEFLRADGGLGPVGDSWVATNRWFIQWWWPVTVVADLTLAWFVLVAHARLLVQLGAVSGNLPELDAARGTRPTPPTRPDCAPASTTPPTA
jgi:hypothetical protein